MKPTILQSYGYLSIIANSIGNITLKVFDTNGRVAKKICKDIMDNVEQLDINISDLANGTYIVNAFSGDTFLKSFRFIKQ